MLRQGSRTTYRKHLPKDEKKKGMCKNIPFFFALFSLKDINSFVLVIFTLKTIMSN
jgi:hypothetical protein